MPKTPFNIKEFDGGLNTKDDQRAVGPNQATALDNLMVNKKGYLRLQGNPVEADRTSRHIQQSANYNSLDLTYMRDATLKFEHGEQIFKFYSDKLFQDSSGASDTGSEVWVWTNPLSGWVYFYRVNPAINSFWATIDTVDISGGVQSYHMTGLPCILLNGGATTGASTPVDNVCYYNADGQLRIVNGSFNVGTYVGGSSPEANGTDQWGGSSCDETVNGHTTEVKCRYEGNYQHSNYNAGSKSMWVWYIKNSYLNSAVAVDQWESYCAHLMTPALKGTSVSLTSPNIISGLTFDSTWTETNDNFKVQNK